MQSNQHLLRQLYFKLLIAGAILLVYGFLCQVIPVYFFWESKSAGYGLLLLGLGVMARQKRQTIKSGSKRIAYLVVLVLSIFMFVGQVGFHIAVRTSDAFEATQAYFLTSGDSLKKELGNIEGFSFSSSGSVQATSTHKGQVSTAHLNIIVKGTKAYKVYTVDLINDGATGKWEVFHLWVFVQIKRLNGEFHPYLHFVRQYINVVVEEFLNDIRSNKFYVF